MRCVAMLAIALLACGGDEDDLPPGEPGHFVITGTARYDDRPQLTAGPLGNPMPKPARGVLVNLIVDSNKAVLASTVSDDNGEFMFEFDGITNAKVHVQLVATSTLPSRPINVRHAQTEIIHAFGGPTFGLASGTQDVLVPVASGVAEAFNIFDVLIDVMDQIPAMFPGRNAEQIDALWHDGNQDGTFYFGSTLFLLGEESDSDGYDDTVILHEAGHWVEDVYGRSDSPGGGHDGSPTDPTLAWSEGFSTYFSMAITNKPIYADSNAGGGFAFNADTSNTTANGNGSMSQNVSEDMIAEILWDMSDTPGTDDDQVAASHVLVVAVEAFLKFASLRGGAGVSGVDLVDFLDGWFVNNGLSSCSGMRALINTKHAFPYDYGSSAGACP